MSRLRRLLLLGLPVLAVFAVLLTALVMAGSWRGALQYIGGERVILDPISGHTISGPSTRPVVFQANVRNLTGKPLSLIGFNATCSCTSSSDIPQTIPPGKSTRMPIVVDPTGYSESFSQSFTFFKDSEFHREIQGNFFVEVRS